MYARRMGNNEVMLEGEVVSAPVFNRAVFGEGFFMLDLQIQRRSGCADILPVLISESLLDRSINYRGQYLWLRGELRSHREYVEERYHLALVVFAQEVQVIAASDRSAWPNRIYLNGSVCKPPRYRQTPSGQEITELLVAVSRSYAKNDYLPCICWSYNARRAAAFTAGDQVKIWGRVQSRRYLKKLEENRTERHVTYEVSVGKLVYASRWEELQIAEETAHRHFQ